jgi:hypothetical protein
VKRADPLSSNAPVVDSSEPASLSVGGSKVFEVAGRNFESDCKAFINGKARDLERLSETRLRVSLVDEDLAAESRLSLVIQNPTTKQGYSAPFTVSVEKR